MVDENLPAINVFAVLAQALTEHAFTLSASSLELAFLLIRSATWRTFFRFVLGR